MNANDFITISSVFNGFVIGVFWYLNSTNRREVNAIRKEIKSDISELKNSLLQISEKVASIDKNLAVKSTVIESLRKKAASK